METVKHMISSDTQAEGMANYEELLAAHEPEEIFTEYAYFSSYSRSWLAHAKSYVDLAAGRFGLGGSSLVVELGSNDGYLLQYFVERGIPVLGIEPDRVSVKAKTGEGVGPIGREEAIGAQCVVLIEP